MNRILWLVIALAFVGCRRHEAVLPALAPEPVQTTFVPELEARHVLARIGDQEVTVADAHREQARYPMLDLYAATWSAIDRRVIAAEAARLGVAATDVDVDRAMQRFMEEYGVEPTALAVVAEAAGLTEAQLREDFAHAQNEARVLGLRARARPHRKRNGAVAPPPIEDSAPWLRTCLRHLADVELLVPEWAARVEPVTDATELRSVSLDAAPDLAALLQPLLPPAGPVDSACTLMRDLSLRLRTAMEENGYIDGSAEVVWPEVIGPSLSLQVRARGRPMVLGKLIVDCAHGPFAEHRTQLEQSAEAILGRGEVLRRDAFEAMVAAVEAQAGPARVSVWIEGGHAVVWLSVNEGVDR